MLESGDEKLLRNDLTLLTNRVIELERILVAAIDENKGEIDMLRKELNSMNNQLGPRITQLEKEKSLSLDSTIWSQTSKLLKRRCMMHKQQQRKCVQNWNMK